jgi:hypothetical protein
MRQAAPFAVDIRLGFLPPVEMTDEVLVDSSENMAATKSFALASQNHRTL